MLLAALLAFSVLAAPSDCAAVAEQAEAAYAARTPETLLEAAAQLRAARTCLLPVDRRGAARLHVLEIYTLYLSGVGHPYRASVRAYLETFTFADGQRQFAFVTRHSAFDAWARGDLPEALETLHHLLTVTPATQVQSRVETLLRLGETYRLMSQYDRSVAYLRQGDSIAVRHLRGALQDEQRSRLLVTLSETLLEWHRMDPGRAPALDAAVRTARHGLSLSTHPTERAHFLHLLGSLYTSLDSLDTGARYLGDAVALAERTDQFQYVMALTRLGESRMRSGDPGAAALFDAAYERAIERAYFVWARGIRLSQAALVYQQGDRQAAKAYLRDAIDLVEALRAETGTTEWAARAVSGWQAPYRDLARVLAQEDSVAQALGVLEMARARHLSALQARLRRLNRLTPAEGARADSLMRALSTTREALYDATGAARDNLLARTATLQQQLDALVGTAVPAAPFDLARVQQRLRAEGGAVLYYAADQSEGLDEATPRVSVYVVRPDTVAFHALATTPERIEALVAQIGEALRSDVPGPTSGASAAFRLDALHALYRDLIAPVAPLLPAGTRLTIVPDGVLFAVPFAALVIEPVGRFAYGQARYVGDAYPLRVALSLEDTDASEASTVGGGVLVAGKTRFEEAALPSLGGVRREIAQVRGLFADAAALLDADATYPRFVEEARHRRIIHLATHALLDRTSPLYHALVLTPTPDDDGLLRLHEIETLRLDADLVTLSGCNTARGDLRPGEGMAGLQYAFRAVGARSTVSTLWSLNDAASAELFEAFYRHLAAGLPKDVALHRAQQAYRQAHPDASPFFWAAPVLYGAADPVAGLAEPFSPPWPYALALVCLAAIAAWARRRHLAHSLSA